MPPRPKANKKMPKNELAGGPNEARRQHSHFARDVLTPPGAPVIARHRVRTVLTPLLVRRAILEEAADKPEAVRTRSLRRRLTSLDRALSDKEAESLERLTSCIHNLSNVGCTRHLQSEIRSSPFNRLPFSEGRRRDIAAMSYVLRGLSALHKSVVFELAILLDPSQSQQASSISQNLLELACAAAGAAAARYNEWEREEKRRSQQPVTEP